jgi:DnaK suppressor protein
VTGYLVGEGGTMTMEKRFTDSELESFKKKLEQLREEILAEYKEISSNVLNKSSQDITGDLSNHSMHLADMATDSYDRDFSIGLASNEMQMLNKIEHALRKIEDGSYGICEHSGKPIPKSRLNAIPYALYTKESQEELENGERSL